MTSPDSPPVEFILLVDDIPDHHQRYASALRDHGYQVEVTHNGNEAVIVARRNLPHCAVIDTRLPDMSGWDLCRMLKADDHLKCVPIVMLTQDVSKDAAVESARSGCNSWLARPTLAEDLVRAVRFVLAQGTDAPADPDEAMIGITVCPACESNQIRAGVRFDGVQYYCCKSCGLCWRFDLPGAPSA